MSSPRAPAFLRFWCTDLTREAFLSCLPQEALRLLRLVCHDFSVCAAPFLFSEVKVEFRSSTFTRPARMAALERIGHYVKSFLFTMPHSPSTFLPPLLDPITGQEVTFAYTPQVHTLNASGFRSSVPKYGTWEMTDLLTRQYPPLFHAATNVHSFTRALRAMPNLNRMTISCDGQPPGHQYRRSMVDYALISLRIAIEQAPLPSLESFSLLPVHPGSLLYLRHIMGFGSSPNASKRWAQIKKLKIQMSGEGFGFVSDYDQHQQQEQQQQQQYLQGQQLQDQEKLQLPQSQRLPTDHLRILHSYIQGFAGLREFTFSWKGKEKGPCPLTLHSEPCLVDPDRKGKPPALQPIKLPHLRYMEVENVTLDATQVSSFIMEHRHTVNEFNYEETELRSGTWDEALAPLTRISGSEQWKKKQEEVMDVPIVFSPVAMEMRHVRKAIWDEVGGAGHSSGRHSRHNRDHSNNSSNNNYHSSKDRQQRSYAGSSNFQRATSRTRELLWGGPDHMRRLLRSSVFSWR